MGKYGFKPIQISVNLLLQAIRDQAMTHLEKEREALVNGHQAECEKIRSELEHQLSSVEQCHAEKISSLETEHKAELDRLIAEHEARVTELSSRLGQVEVDAANHGTVMEKHRSDIEELEKKWSEDTALLITQREEAEAEYKQVLVVNWETIKSVTSKHDLESVISLDRQLNWLPSKF